MTVKELRDQLLEAYTVSNLNKISLTLISLFKAKQYSVLQRISEILSDFTDLHISDDGKGFSKFMMLYHPDRAVFHINEINRLAGQNNFDALLEYSHILKLERIEEIAYSISSYEDIDYSPVYDWDFETEGFSVIYDTQPSKNIKTKTSSKPVGYTFYDAIKLREYGHTEIEYPSFYLEDIEEFELSGSDINDLDGVQFCIHANAIDVSDNRISDLSPLSGLLNLEELNLSDNQIGYIDGLSNLTGLKTLFISNNLIDDITPLFELEKLEYVDLSGNRISPEQIDRLTEKGVNVTYDSSL
ncbi:MAG: leucine-rich repeat domain-containing protein [Bacteroidales bacterium]|nr:leucine-rich repeat domain-containing protein [Bacteroidales bacterium]